MGVASNDSVTGKPVYNNTPQTQSDLQKAADFAEFIGVGRVASFASLSALPYQPVGLVRIVDADGFPYMRLSSGWSRLDKVMNATVPLTIASAYDKNVDPYKAVAFTKFGRVYLKGNVRNAVTLTAAASTRYVAGSIPAAYAPDTTLRFPSISFSGNSPSVSVVEVTTTGEIGYWVSVPVSAAPAGGWSLNFSGASWEVQS